MTACLVSDVSALSSDETATKLRHDRWDEEVSNVPTSTHRYRLGMGNDRPIPLLAIRRYAERAARVHTVSKRYADGTWWVSAPELAGTFGEGQTLDEARRDLISVIFEWVIAKIEDEDRDLPAIEGTFDLNTI